MLSAESAAGKYPVEAVSTMNRIGEEVERDPTYRGVLNAQRAEPEPTAGDAIADAARADRRNARPVRDHLLDQFGLDGAARGARAAEAAGGRHHAEPRDRPQACRWSGACTAWSRKTPTTSDDMVDRAGRIAFRDGFAKAGQRIIIVAGVPLGTPGATNMLRIAFVGPNGEADI